MERFRNLAFLEQQLDEHNKEEQDKYEETESSLKRMQSRLQEQEIRLLREDKDNNDRKARPTRPSGKY
jgi:clusterin-associated protein 1